MIKVLIANKNKSEGESWRNMLTQQGYEVVPGCSNLSEFVYAVSREKIHFAICSSNLIENNAFAVLNAAAKFFPRTKIVLVGGMKYLDTSYALRNMINVIIKKEFNTDLEKYLDTRPIDRNDSTLSPDKQILQLLGEHFFSPKEAAAALSRAQPKWRPEFAALSIISDSYHDQVFKLTNRVISELSESNHGYAYQVCLGEICVILENSPSEKTCLNIADELHKTLMKNTDAMFSIGISRPKACASELYICWNEARRAASTQYLYGWNSIIRIEWLGDCDIEYAYPMHKEKVLVQRVMDGDRDGAIAMLDEIFKILEGRDIRQSMINKIALGILVRLNISAGARAGGLEKIQIDSLSLGKLLDSKTKDDAYNFLKNGIRDFADEMDAFTDFRRDIMFMELTKLKSKKTDITLSDLMHTFNVSLGFLNSVITRNTDSNIFDFFE